MNTYARSLAYNRMINGGYSYYYESTYHLMPTFLPGRKSTVKIIRFSN